MILHYISNFPIVYIFKSLGTRIVVSTFLFLCLEEHKFISLDKLFKCVMFSLLSIAINCCKVLGKMIHNLQPSFAAFF